SARTSNQRTQSLAPAGLVSQQEVEHATTAVAQAEAAEAASKAQVAALATRLGETKIESPLDGYVSVRKLDPGALVGLQSGSAIVTLVRVDVVRAFVTIGEKSMHGIAVGKDAHVELDALPGKTFAGKVVRVAPTLDPSTRTLDAEVQIANPNEELRPGMFGRGSIVVEVHPHAVVVPAGSLQITEDKRYVFALEGDRVRRRAVTTGVDEGTWLEVLGGLKEGEEIVTAGMDGLADGAQVRVQRGAAPFSAPSA